MLAGNGCDKATWSHCELVHSDINAIIAGPDADGSWYSKCPGPDCPYPLESVGKKNPQLPNRLEAFRDFTSIYHDAQTNSQVFPNWYNNPVMSHVLHGVGDAFMINYGSGGIGSEIIANRLHTGPMHDCTDCAYEEFFLASQTVGDPALLVAFPANTGIEACDPAAINGANCWRDPVNLANGPIEGNIALYQEDPSNVHHAYTGDFVKYRNIHAGAFEQHIFHFHNHQWLFNPNDDNANYLDAQEIMPGSGHTYELVNGGAGNRNHTTGDAIFHCHFYPHFAQGMWYHQRNHDVFETGTVLAVSGVNSTPTAKNPHPAQKAPAFDPAYPDLNFHDQKWELRSGEPMARSRALPDGELAGGSPIPAIIPLPGKPMPYMPAHVEIRPVDRGGFSILGGRTPPDPLNPTPDSSQAVVDRASTVDANGDLVSPGYPFWLAGNECGPGIDLDDIANDLLVGDACPQGIVGQRMPTPPLDMLTEEGAKANAGNPNAPGSGSADVVDWENLGGGWDGGLPRHALLGYVSGGFSLDTQNRLDFRKIVEIAKPVYFPETGTDLEQLSMAYQAVRNRDSYANTFGGISGLIKDGWKLNGAPPVPGGPYNDPCVDDNGVQLKNNHVGNWYDGDDLKRWDDLSVKGKSPFDAENPRTYKIANLQIDAVFNKVGYHYSQERIIILWDDVQPTIFKERPPEPLVMRFNTFDCGKLLHANLVPHEFEVDDFQVRTPTDIIGQHIHLPKWDLTTNDGAANGWNYEDGALSPGIVEERILAINNYNQLAGQSIGVVDAAVQLGFAGKVHPDVVALLQARNTTLDLSDLDPVLTINTGDPGGTPANLGCVEDPVTGACPDGEGLLEARDHPFFGHGGDAWGGQHYKGARTVIQRILVDPVVNVSGVDRGLGLTFSHDHYGPSTFQQIGLYSTILAEPAGSTWVHNESGQPLYGRQIKMADGTPGGTDGGPTSWQAAIMTGTEGGYSDNVGGADVPEHREFYFEMSDFQHAYEHGVYIGADANGVPQLAKIFQPNAFDATNAEIAAKAAAPGMDDPRTSWLESVNPTLKLTAGMGVAADAFPDTVNAHPGCPGPAGQNDGTIPRPCAEAINIGHSSMWVVNYRNEPVALRVFDPSKTGPDGSSGSQADGQAGDLALAFQSRNDRAISLLNDSFGRSPYPQESYCQGNGDGINCDRGPGDPFTPIMRAYENDIVKVKIQVGATEEQHQTTIHGVKWLSNGSGFGRSPNSGWRNFQSHGISEQFTLHMPVIPDRQDRGNATDYLYATDATRDGIWGGTWGILRTYKNGQQDLLELPNNQIVGNVNFTNENNFNGVCPRYVLDENGEPVGSGKGKNKTLIEVPVKQFTVFAVKANDVLPNNLGVIIPSNVGEDLLGNPVPGDSDGNGRGDNVGGPLDPDGGTLVYNRRGTAFNICEKGFNEDGTCAGGLNRDVAGPLNDPTALMYVLEEDVEPRFIEGVSPDGTEGVDDSTTGTLYGENGIDDRCERWKADGTPNLSLAEAGCPVKLKANAPVEPLVLRAEAGDCIEATLVNKLLDQATVNGSPVYTTAGKAIFDELKADKEANALVDYYGKPVNRADLVFDTMPDLAGWQDTFWVVNRDLFKPVNQRNKQQMSFFGNNLIRPSEMAGLHAQLVEYDASQDDGVVVGQNPQSIIAGPGELHTYRWYAGHVDSKLIGISGKGKNQKRDFVRLAFPVEFGGANLLSADRVKQPQKGMFAALVIEPKGALIDDSTLVADGQMACEPAVYPEGHPNAGEIVLDPFGNTQCATDMDGNVIIDPDGTRSTRAQVTVTADAVPDDPEKPETQGVQIGVGKSSGIYREAVAVTHKIANLRWADGSTVKNVGQPEFGVEGAEDSGHAGYNYGMEPSWFRFKIAPDAPSAGAKKANGAPVVDGTYGTIPNVQAMFANELVRTEPNAIPNIPGVAVAGDPQTPVFRTTADVNGTNSVFDTRMHVLNGASADRDSTFILHGHVWQRDPFVCTGVLGSEEDMDVQNARAGTDVNLEGRCDPAVIAPSNALGLNRQAKYMGGEEGMGHVFGHWPILFDAGGTGAVAGDYLFRDYAPNGNIKGMFGILRVE
jgi:hypothetical protein